MANSTCCLLTYRLLLSVMFHGQQYVLFADVLFVVDSDVSWPTVRVVC